MKTPQVIYSIIFMLCSCQDGVSDLDQKVEVDRFVEDTVKSRVDSISTTEEVHSTPDPHVEDSIRVFTHLKQNPYPFDTILSNGYHLKHKVFKDSADPHYLQSLTLMKGNREIKEFGSSSFFLPYKNIGYVGADFQESFVMVYSFGSGNPHMIKLINKETGDEQKSGTWVDANESEEILVYIENEHEENEQIKILDVENGHEIIVDDFNESKCAKNQVGGLRDCVSIDTVTSNKVVLKVDSYGEEIIREYSR